MKQTHKISRRSCHLTLMLVALIAVAGRVSAATLYVNQNDTNATYRTITSAVAAANPGDMILVYPGTYIGSVSISGITLKSLSGPEVTVIQAPSNGSGTGVILSGSSSVAFIGFRVQGFASGIYIGSSGITKIANCISTGNAAAGFEFGTSMPTWAQILNNISADNGGDGFHTDNNPGYDLTYTGVINNISYANSGYGFHAYNDNGYHLTYTTTFGGYNCSYGNTLGSAGDEGNIGSNSTTSNPNLIRLLTYRFNTSSPCIDKGNPSAFYNDPDNSRNDMGAYGGLDAANWWRSPLGGPTIQNVTVDPPQVLPGGTVTIRATAVTQ